MDKEIRIYGVNDFQELKNNSWSELISSSENGSWTDTELNDFIWFEDEWYFQELGMEWK